MKAKKLEAIRTKLDQFDQEIFLSLTRIPKTKTQSFTIKSLINFLYTKVSESFEPEVLEKIEAEFDAKNISSNFYAFDYLEEIFGYEMLDNLSDRDDFGTWLGSRGLVASQLEMIVARLEVVHSVSTLKKQEGETVMTFRKTDREQAIFKNFLQKGLDYDREELLRVLQFYRLIMFPFAFEMERSYLV